MTRVLLADDDRELTELLREYLEDEGFQVVIADDGETALELAREGGYDLVILDVMMPGLNGFDVLRRLRQCSSVPVLMLTARGGDIDSVLGLELGADDYLPKPCNPRVLVARMRAILRRAEVSLGTPTKDVLGIADLEFRPAAREVYVAGRPVALTSTEFSVLEVLLRSAGQVVDKDSLSRQALGRELTRYDRSLDMHISNLRRKLGPLDGGQERIKTVRGVGYQYSLPPEA